MGGKESNGVLKHELDLLEAPVILDGGAHLSTCIASVNDWSGKLFVPGREIMPGASERMTSL